MTVGLIIENYTFLILSFAFSIIVEVLNEEITLIDKTDLFGTWFLVPCFGPTSSLRYR